MTVAILKQLIYEREHQLLIIRRLWRFIHLICFIFYTPWAWIKRQAILQSITILYKLLYKNEESRVYLSGISITIVVGTVIHKNDLLKLWLISNPFWCCLIIKKAINRDWKPNFEGIFHIIIPMLFIDKDRDYLKDTVEIIFILSSKCFLWLAQFSLWLSI